MGDVYRLTCDSSETPSAIAIVDGLFEQVPSVWHKEILYAIESGIPVFGAASMGALRAAELYQFGMHGVGSVFEGFKSGELEDDDEVAIAHGPVESDYRILSIALVNIRAGLALAEERGLITAASHRILMAAAKAQFYPQRSWLGLKELGESRGLAPENMTALVEFLKQENPDVKADDARTLFRLLTSRQERVTPKLPTFILNKTKFWYHMTGRAASVAVDGVLTGDQSDVTIESLWDHVRLVDDGVALEREILLKYLMSQDSDTLAFVPDTQAIQAAARRILRAGGCSSGDEIDSWLANRQMKGEDLVDLSCDEVTIRRCWKQHESELMNMLPRELKRQGRFAEILDVVRRKTQMIRELGIVDPTFDDAGVDESSLFEWYERTFRPLTSTPEVHARERGFKSLRDFLSALLTHYLFEMSEDRIGGG